MISVLMPAYNAALYIKEAIESLLTQTYKDFEILVLDDGSTDGTAEIVKTFSDSRVRYFVEGRNKGIIYQLNKGIALANGDYIARMDADDVCKPYRLEVQLDYMKRNPHLDVLGSFATTIGREKRELKYPTLPPAIDFTLNYTCPVLHPSVMMKSSLFKQRGYNYKNVPYAEDYQLWIDISNGNNIANLNQSLIYYRLHAQQTNQVKFFEQYHGAMIARQSKLQKTLSCCSEALLISINSLANDYLFYGYTKTDITNHKISYLDYLAFQKHYLLNINYHNSTVNFVQNQLSNNGDTLIKSIYNTASILKKVALAWPFINTKIN